MESQDRPASYEQRRDAYRLDAPIGEQASIRDAAERLEESGYNRFTGPARIEKGLNVLEGLLRGITADRKLLPGEIAALQAWRTRHLTLLNRPAIKQVSDAIELAIADDIITTEEREDLLWLCSQAKPESPYFCVVTADMQTLHGILGGIAADGRIVAEELEELRQWMDDHSTLRSMWPYDEIDTLITMVMRDGRIDPQEHQYLVAFCSEFIGRSPSIMLEPATTDLIRHGVCASNVEIEFAERLFCFTGKSTRATRKQLWQVVRQYGGYVVDSPSKGLHYLIVGDHGNAAWAFTAYGRKIETVMSHRREGATTFIVHEFDFWDAVENAGGKRPAKTVGH